MRFLILQVRYDICNFSLSNLLGGITQQTNPIPYPYVSLGNFRVIFTYKNELYYYIPIKDEFCNITLHKGIKLMLHLCNITAGVWGRYAGEDTRPFDAYSQQR